ncbi:hypothetical protein QTH97_10585 [Variovorax sp. J22R24]|uniref:hypothetical protein n=1 Tax=Variovorax gracilis TaxID=3053502 RepID=UPI002577CD6B|nr:hypothetical protein [Variovorax sp. J22R24]MDM0105380.1 hypothetical protein [Variovorax sp. J22R24]
MSYESTRDAEQLRMLGPSIEAFIDRYNNNTNWQANGVRHTVFVLPGGMGCRLRRAKTPYVDGLGGTQTFDYDLAWIDAGTLLFGNSAKLMLGKGPEYRDKGDRIIIADGSIGFLGCTPYSGFTDWCEEAGLDYFVYGWDWRRRIEHGGRFFVEKFLPFFRDRVKSGCNNADPLQKFSVIGHSAGGMVVNWIFRRNHAITATMYRAITVATPFYGYASQLHRWFTGEPYLNSGDLYRAKIIQAICSMPACYAWLYLDGKTFIKYETLLKNDPQYPLKSYPCVDATDPTVWADPYRPKTNGSQVRYPEGNSGFSHEELHHACKLVRRLASDFASDLPLDKFYNVRCDTGRDDTAGSSTWKWTPPTLPSPIDDVSKVPGDDTQPGWSARHVGLASIRPLQVVRVLDPHAEHAFTMNCHATIVELAKILGAQVPAVAASLPVEIASSEEAFAFVQMLQRKFSKRISAAEARVRLRALIAKKLSIEKQRAIARRIYVDLLGPPLPTKSRPKSARKAARAK